MVTIRNLKCNGLYSYGSELDIRFAQQSIIVGPNNSGKSTLFRIINLFVETFYTSRNLEEWESFSNTSNSFIETNLSFSKDEVERILDFFTFYTGPQNQTTEFYKFKNRDFLLKNLDDVRIRLTWEPNLYRQGSEAVIEFEFEKVGLKIFSRGRYGTVSISNKMPKNLNSLPTIGESKINDLLDKLGETENPKEYVNKFFDEVGDAVLLMHQINQNVSQSMPLEAKDVVKGIFAFLGLELGRNYYISFFPFIGVILKNGIYHSTDRRSLSKTFLDFAKKLKTEEDLEFDHKLMEVAKAQTMKYSDTLENDGSNLSQFLFSLKQSENLDKRTKFEEIKKAFENIIKSEDLSFDVHLEYEKEIKSQNMIGAEEQWKPASPKIVIIDRTRNKQYPIDQVGSGLLEVIFLLTISYGIKNSIILLDEPSLNLHPPLMRSLMKSIENLQNKNQFMIITHSPELLYHEMFENNAMIFYVKKTDQSSTVKSLNGDLRQWFEENRGRFKHQIDTRIFFGKCVILTEGEADRNLLGIAQYFESLDDDFSMTKNDIVITSVGGKNNFSKYRKLLEAYGIPYMVLADFDAKSLFDSYGTISKNTINENGPVYVIDGGDLEQFMRDINLEAYTNAEFEFRGSKPTIAFEFAKKIESSNNLDTLKLFLEIAIKKARN